MTELCRVCGHSSQLQAFKATIKGRLVSYYECPNCSYVQTQYPSWLEDAYSEPIDPSDTGIIVRNLQNVKLVISTMVLLGAQKGQVVDYAGGHGLLVRMLRDKGINALWSDRYALNLYCNGFEYSGGKADLVSAFEAFEHFVEPLAELKRLIEIAPNILFTTSIMPTPAPLPEQWWYYGLQHGQHIGFFRIRTLEYLAETLDLYLTSDECLVHLLSTKPVSTLRWRLLRRIAKANLGILTRGLQPKTWADYVQEATKSQR